MADQRRPELNPVVTPALTDILAVRQIGDARDKRETVAQVLGLFVEVNDLTAAVVWANIPDGNVPESAVTQHVGAIDHDSLLNFDAAEHFTQAAISITESQVSDLQAYLVDITGESVADLSDVVSAANTNRFVLAANGTTGYVGRALVEADISDLQSYLLSVPDPLQLSDGSAAAPTYSFSASGQQDVGFYRAGTDAVSLALGGGAQAHWAFTTAEFAGVGSDRPSMRNVSVSNTVPGLTPRNDDSNTGIGRNDPDQLSLIAGGVEIARATETPGASQFAVIQSLNSGVPDLTSLGDPDTGFSWISANQIDAITAGSISWSLSSAKFFSALSDGPCIQNVAANSGVAIFTPDQSDANTGLGANGIDAVSLIAGGIPGLILRELNSGVIQAPSADVAITAFATGGQGSATALTQSYNVISVCASAGDSVRLPTTFFVNSVVHVKNDGAESADVFPASGDNLGAGVDTAVAVAAGESVVFIATAASATWTQLLVFGGGVPDPLLLGNGSAGAPTYGFASDDDTGFFLNGTGELRVTVAGVAKWQFRGQFFEGLVGNSPILMAEAATATNPTFAPRAGTPSSGIGAANEGDVTIISASLEGSSWANFNGGILQSHACDKTITAFAGGGIGAATTLKQSYNIVTVVASPDDSVRLPFQFAVNTVVHVKNDSANSLDVFPNNASDNLGQGTGVAEALPAGASVAYIATVLNSTWTPFIVLSGAAAGDVTKVGTPADNQVGVWTGDGTIEGTSALVLGANSLDISTRVRTANAAAGAPSHSFTGETNSGMYLQSSGSVGISCLGGGNWLFQTGSMFANLAGGPQIMFEASTASNPVLNPRLSDTDTGIGSGAADQMDFIAGGLSCMAVRETAAARQIGFYTTAPISQQTGVAVSAAALHAALVALGLITA